MPGETHKARLRVLVLDEDAVILRTRRIALAPIAELHCCSFVSEAMELIEALHFDVAIVDQQLSDGSGLEFLTHLRQIFPKIRRLMCSSVLEDTLAMGLRDDTIQGFFRKPVSPGVLRREIQALNLDRSEG